MIKFSPNGSMYAISPRNYPDHGKIKVYSSSNNKIMNTVDIERENGFCFTSDSKHIAVLLEGVTIIEIPSGNKVWNAEPNFEAFKSVCSAPDGNYLAVGGEYDTDGEYEDPNITSIALLDWVKQEIIWEQRRGLYEKVLFSQDGKNLYAIGTASVNRNLTSTVNSIDLEEGGGTQIFKEKNRLRFWDFDISPDGTMIAACGSNYVDPSENHPIVVVDLTSERERIVEANGYTYFSKKESKRLVGHADAVNSVHFSPDGKLVVSTSDDHTIRVWDVSSGDQIKKIDLYAGDAIFTPNGREIMFLSKGKVKFVK
ncbi:MAG: WD40 repeat domain-containing protein [Promethearchaeota archaeon]